MNHFIYPTNELIYYSYEPVAVVQVISISKCNWFIGSAKYDDQVRLEFVHVPIVTFLELIDTLCRKNLCGYLF